MSYKQLPPLSPSSSHASCKREDTKGSALHPKASRSIVLSRAGAGTPSRRGTPSLGDDVLNDPAAAMYVSLWKQNVGKSQRSAQLTRMAGVASTASDQLAIEETLVQEEQQHLQILSSIARSLMAELQDGIHREEELRGRIESAAHAKNPTMSALRTAVVNRKSEVASIQNEIERKRVILAARKREADALHAEISRLSSICEEQRSAANVQQKATLSEFLGLRAESTSAQSGGHASPSGAAASSATSVKSRDDWLLALRRNRGENLDAVFQEAHASPLTMLLSPKANFGHRRDETRRMLETISYMSPANGVLGSFSGADEQATYDVSGVAAVSSSLEQRLAKDKKTLENTILVTKDPERLRILDTFQRYEDQRGTIEYVAKTPIELLRKQRKELQQVFECP